MSPQYLVPLGLKVLLETLFDPLECGVVVLEALIETSSSAAALDILCLVCLTHNALQRDYEMKRARECGPERWMASKLTTRGTITQGPSISSHPSHPQRNTHIHMHIP